MGIISTADLATLRKFPQKSNLYLVIQQPRVVWTGTIASAVSEDPTVKLSSVYSTGDNPGTVQLFDGMTALIGTSVYGYERGIVRVHGHQTMLNNQSVAQTLYIAASSDLRNVQRGDYVTVINEFRFWPRYPRVVPGDGVVTWYKDYGVFLQSLGRTSPGLLFSDLPSANALYPPVPILGPHRVVFLEPNQHIDIEFDFTNSYTLAPGSSITQYASAGENGIFGWSSTSSTPTVRYAKVSGMSGFLVRLEVAAGSNTPISEFRTGYRFVFTLRRPGRTQPGDPDYAEPITDFEVSSMSGSFDSGRWRSTIRLFGDTDKYKILPGALVILFSDDRYGNENRSVGPLAGHENIVLIGRIADGTIAQDSESGDVTFDIVSIGEQASRRENYAVPIENNTAPVNWYQAGNLTVDRAALWLVCWHSTLANITDFYVIGESVPIPAHDFLASNFYSMIDSFLNDRRYARLLFDRYERAKCEIDLQMREEGSGVEYWTLQDGDWIGELEFKRIVETQTSLVHGGGIIYNNGEIKPVLSNAPGAMARYSGTVVNKTNLAVTSQSELNNLTGRHLASDNLPYRLTLQTANWRYPDIWPQGYLIVSRDTPLRSFIAERFIFRNITYEFSDGVLMARYDLDYDAHGPAGIGVYPGVTMTIDGEIVQPPPPSVPSEEPSPPRPTVNRWPGAIIGVQNNGVWITAQLSGNSTSWMRLGSGINTKSIVDLLFVDYGSAQYVYALATDGIYAYTNLPQTNKTWATVCIFPSGLIGSAIHAAIRFPGWIYATATNGFEAVLYWTPNWFTSAYSGTIRLASGSNPSINRVGVWSSPNTPRNVFAAYSYRTGIFTFTSHIECSLCRIGASNNILESVTALDTSDNNPMIANDCWIFVPHTNGNKIFYGSFVTTSDYPGGYPIRYSTNGGNSFQNGVAVNFAKQAYGIYNYENEFYLRTYCGWGDLLKMTATSKTPFNAYISYPNAAAVLRRSGTSIISALFSSGYQVIQVDSNGSTTDHTGNQAYGSQAVRAIAHYDYVL